MLKLAFGLKPDILFRISLWQPMPHTEKLKLVHTFTLKLANDHYGPQIQVPHIQILQVQIASLKLRQAPTRNQALTFVKSAASPRKKDNSVPKIVTTQWGSAPQVRCDRAVWVLMCVGCVTALCTEYALSVAHRNSVTVCKAVIPCPHGYSTSCVFRSK